MRVYKWEDIKDKRSKNLPTGTLRNRVMWILDWFDCKVLGHRWYGFCTWLTKCSWWDK